MSKVEENALKTSYEKSGLTLRNDMCEISVYSYQFQGEILFQRGIISQTTLIASNQSHYHRQKHAAISVNKSSTMELLLMDCMINIRLDCQWDS